MRYYIIAGEPSGDLHGANLMKGLKRHDPQAGFRFWGGDRMAAEGGTENLVEHYRNTSFFGIWEVIRNARTILGQIDRCKRDIADYAPDVLILIDYPGFNMKMAEFAHNKGIRTFYYIAPKVWAWKEYRVKKIKRWVDRLFIIFPFEIDYFRRWGLDAVFEGNPLCDALTSRWNPYLRPTGSASRTVWATSPSWHCWPEADAARYATICLSWPNWR